MFCTVFKPQELPDKSSIKLLTGRVKYMYCLLETFEPYHAKTGLMLHTKCKVVKVDHPVTSIDNFYYFAFCLHQSSFSMTWLKGVPQ